MQDRTSRGAPSGVKWILLVAIAACAVAPRARAQPAGVATPDSVRPGINERFLDPGLDPEEWVDRFEVESREVFRAREAILRATGAAAGDRVADVGAGTGLFTTLFSDAVGPTGWVYAVDIAPKFIERIGDLAADENLRNVTPVLCAENHVRLAPASVDLVYLCDTYHHFEYPQATLRSIRRALRPGGRLVVVDFERIAGVSSDFVMGHVRAGKEVFRREIEASGFELVTEHDVPGLEENYFLEFRKANEEQ